jgi:hypothetical protein
MFPGLWGGGAWEISFPSQDFCTSSGPGTLFLTGKEKIQDGQCAKFYHNNNGCFTGSGMKDSKEILEFY